MLSPPAAASASGDVPKTPRQQQALDEENLLLSQSAEGFLGDLVERARAHILGPTRTMLDVARGVRNHMTDVELRRYFEQLEQQCPSNLWYKVELRMARIIVNLAGKFEADIDSSRPIFTPKMNDYGLPHFHYEKTKAELGALVKAWMEGPHWNKEEDPASGPVLGVKSKEEGSSRREKYEEDELAYERERGITRVGVHADFSNWGVISTLHGGVTAEDARANNAAIVSTILNQSSVLGHKFGLRLVFRDISVAHTHASMRCVFNGEDWKGQTIFREREVDTLKLIGSNTSAKSLQNLNGAIRLQHLYLDGCPLATNSGKTRANVFDQLTQHGPVPELLCLSLVGTSAHLSSDWLSKVEAKCPKLALVYFTRRPGDKALGWSDVVMMQSMREPSLLPCGHVGDAQSLRHIRCQICPICRTPYTMAQLVVLRANVTQLTRVADSWKATIVDTLRYPLDDKVLYHECGEFFNLSSLRTLYACDAKAEINPAFVESMKTHLCLRCSKPFERLYICYPRSAVEDEAGFSTLSEACGYFAQDIDEK